MPRSEGVKDSQGGRRPWCRSYFDWPEKGGLLQASFKLQNQEV